MSGSPAAQRLSLMNDYGASKGVNAPASHTVHLYAGHPRHGGTQLTTGYTPPAVTNDGTRWPAIAVGDSELVGALVTVTFTADLSEPATHWRLLGSDGNWWDDGELGGEVFGGTGKSLDFQPRIFYRGSD